MLSVENLFKFYGDFLALDDVSFHVGKGEVVGLLGPNGAGKSTSMKTIVGYLPQTKGRIRVDGLDISRYPIESRRRIGYLPEHTPLYTDMRVREYLTYRAQLKGIGWRSRKSRVDYVIGATGLEDRERQSIETLSKGYKQRVGIADALVGDPGLLILDEPTIGLDPNQIREVRSLLESLAERHTILLSTHILPEVERVCDRVVVIAKGKIAADDTIDGLRARYRENAVRIALRADETTDALKTAIQAVNGVSSVEPLFAESEGTRQVFWVEAASDLSDDVLAERLVSLSIDRGWPLSELTPQRPTLEQIFVRLTMGELGPAVTDDGERVA
ncbi:MAG: ATP-binding cassette domain-containing protein [Planctomycetes bacterium]|nr:ATP-binding cassette domain-containing protein [Planctomycetota bacterium]